uniref:hypothetical protein n=1 Tax=Neisseria sicca TaxID=490 RepID=UPI0034D97EEC
GFFGGGVRGDDNGGGDIGVFNERLGVRVFEVEGKLDGGGGGGVGNGDEEVDVVERELGVDFFG